MTKIGISQNGWPVYDDTSHFTRVTVAGVGFWAANSDVAVVLGDFTQRYNDTIEPITLPVKERPGYDDWSYAVRPVRGQTTGYSNHASASAWDLNATRHPRGVHGTYPRDLRDKLKDLVAQYHGVLRDGEFYTTSTIDGMHIEINAGPGAVKIEADRIRREREDEMDEKATRALLIDVLKNEKIIPNTTQKGEVPSFMSVARALELIDFGKDRANDQNKAELKRDAGLQATVNVLLSAVQALATNSSDDVRAAFSEGIATLKTELADIDVQVSLGTKETP